MITIQELQSQMEELAKKIDAPAKFFPTFGMSRNDGTPHVEITRDTYYYLAYDRDTVCINRQTTRLPKLMYWIFKDITFQMGLAYQRTQPARERNNAIAFQHQLKLLETLHMQWRELCEQEHAEMLESQAYRDSLLQSKAKIDWEELISMRINKHSMLKDNHHQLPPTKN